MAKPSQRAEQDELRARMRAVGMTHEEIAVEFARRFRLRPRAAFRVALGWTQQQAADHINAHAARLGLDPDGRAAMTVPRLSELENWPQPGRRRPTPRILALLAEVYGTDIHHLLDLDDREHLTPADQLLINSVKRVTVRDQAGAFSDGSGLAGAGGLEPRRQTRPAEQGYWDAPVSPRIIAATASPVEPGEGAGAFDGQQVWDLDPVFTGPSPQMGAGRGRRSRTATADDVLDAREVLKALTVSDREFGGGFSQLKGMAYLRDVLGPMLTATASDPVRKDLFAVAVEFTLRVSAMSLDAGHTNTARRLLGLASSLAHETDDVTLTAWVLARRGEQAIYEKKTGEALAYTAAAGAMARQAPPATRAFILTKHALALSLTGDAAATRRVLQNAANAVDRAGSVDEPAWMSNYGWGHLRHDEALCYTHLALGAEAVEAAEDAIGVRSRMRFARPRAFSLGVQGIALAQAGEVDRACAVGQELVEVATRLASTRVRTRLADLLQALAVHREVAAVQDLHETARPLLAETS